MTDKIQPMDENRDAEEAFEKDFYNRLKPEYAELYSQTYHEGVFEAMDDASEVVEEAVYEAAIKAGVVDWRAKQIAEQAANHISETTDLEA